MDKKTARKLLRYIIMFAVIFLVTQLIPECGVRFETSFILATIGTITFALMDMFYPVII